MTWNCHVGESAKRRYYVILGRYLLTVIVSHIKVSDNAIKSDYGPLKGSTALMVNIGWYIFKYLNTGKITPINFFINAYSEELHELEQVHNSTK